MEINFYFSNRKSWGQQTNETSISLMSDTLLGNFVCQWTLSYQVTLVNNSLTGVTPVKILHTGVTPVGNILTGVTPAENFLTGVTPVENFLTGVTPVENFLTGVTPVKNLEATGTVRQGVVNMFMKYNLQKRKEIRIFSLRGWKDIYS